MQSANLLLPGFAGRVSLSWSGNAGSVQESYRGHPRDTQHESVQPADVGSGRERDRQLGQRPGTGKTAKVSIFRYI